MAIMGDPISAAPRRSNEEATLRDMDAKQELESLHLTTDHVNEIFDAILKAKISEIMHRQLPAATADTHWEWLDCEVNRRVDSAIRRKEEDKVVYLTPQEWLSWYVSLSQAVVAIGTLGAGLCFPIIFSMPADPRPEFSVPYVRACLSSSWLLFVVALGLGSFAALLFSVNKTALIKELAEAEQGLKWYKSWLLSGVVLTVLFEQVVPIGAFLAAAEAVRAYQAKLGVAAEVLISLIAVTLILAWIGQNSDHARRFFGVMGRSGVLQELALLLRCLTFGKKRP